MNSRNTPHSSFPDLSLTKVTISQGHALPRWEANGAIYNITLHLADSVPQAQLAIWNAERERIRSRLADQINPPTADERKLLIEARSAVFNETVEKYLAAGYGESLLRDSRAADALIGTILYGNGSHYQLHAYCVMPNHIHIVAGGLGDAGKLKNVVDTWKRVSAHRINSVLDRIGEVWRRDAFTRIIRDHDEYKRQLSYVWNNPETAGLTSGYRRERFVAW